MARELARKKKTYEHTDYQHTLRSVLQFQSVCRSIVGVQYRQYSRGTDGTGQSQHEYEYSIFLAHPQGGRHDREADLLRLLRSGQSQWVCSAAESSGIGAGWVSTEEAGGHFPAGERQEAYQTGQVQQERADVELCQFRSGASRRAGASEADGSR